MTVHIDAIPGPIVQAVCKVQAAMEAVSKTQKNQHGGYQFASTDDIYAALTRKLGEVGLMILGLEDDHDIVRVEKDGKVVQWLRVTYSFVLATAEATWSDPRSRRSLYIQVTGPQTFQAAQSYAEKSYLRSLFKIPTGDMDLDTMPQGETEESQMSHSGNGRKRKSSSSAKKDGTDHVFNEIRRHIQGAGDVESLQYIRETYSEEWAAMPNRWAEIIDQEYDDRMTDIRGARQ